ncbi:CpsB/CapC family capsule biosynthesis tyrosine phosphatase [uncultured Ruminococcus sp.]|uniref:CpsB/CapC family capsule biosynthesis tyrosine phosphatase n=1 Tax=uncultured Ruminococcus sp. TaxID=165186 RepID=UPI0026390A4B|nr:CpsB/CapC family capsule biosynthesis tyrosine phosphatase [uncultured Ruminococcus sp.]
MTEYHCHILPNIDDGSRSVEMSLEMIKAMRAQGVSRIVATPHFYAHREKSVAAFLKKRRAALEKLVKADPSCSDILTGAEVSVEQGLSSLADVEKLRIANTDYILLELPYAPFSNRFLEEINEIACGFGLKPVLAHIHRYLSFYSRSEMEEVLRTDAVLQFNNEAFGSFREKRFVKSLIKEGYPYVFGSDAHNLTDRRPNWDLLCKKAKQEVIDGAEDILGQDK